MKEQDSSYIIGGGAEGKKRLEVLSEVLGPYTAALLKADGPISGKKILDLGCGGGNVALMAAGMTGAKGLVTAIDFDTEIISLAQRDAEAKGFKNVVFQAGNVYEIDFHNDFDIAYARFLLSHLEQAGELLQKMLKSVRPGGKVIVEDLQFSGHFCYPPSEAFDSYIRYYTRAALSNRQNPEIGPSLYQLFQSVGMERVSFDVIQPCFTSGPGKWMAWLTLDRIKPMLIKQEIAGVQGLEQLLSDLERFTLDPKTIISLPRIFRVWGYKPAQH